MVKFKLGKLQVKRLLAGEYIQHNGQSIGINNDVREVFEEIDKADVYDLYNIIFIDGGITIEPKENIHQKEPRT